MSQSILVISYSQTGQLNQLVQNFLQPLRANPEISIEEVNLKPQQPYAFPWRFIQFFNTFPESVHRGKNAHSPNCEIIAVASLTDHHNLTNCNQAMLEQLLQQCLTNANLQPQHIRAIKVHAVGSNSDEMEQQVLSTFFPQAQWILTKPYMGHTLGASGALETALLFHSMNNPLGYFPEYANLPIMQNCSLSAGYYLNYFLGFGGSNVAWILKIE